MKPPAVPPIAQRRLPGLSETLRGPVAPDACQCCGATDVDLTRWRECNPWDKPTQVIVVLCSRCSTRLIKPHPRLYVQLFPFDPWPGCMPLCLPCRRRDGTRCTHPQLKANGGPGLLIEVPRGTTAHFNYGGGHGEWRTVRDRWPSACAGREEVPAT